MKNSRPEANSGGSARKTKVTPVSSASAGSTSVDKDGVILLPRIEVLEGLEPVRRRPGHVYWRHG